MKVLFDSNAWMTYFEGGKKAEKVKKLLKANYGKILTTSANLYEVKYVLLRTGRGKAEQAEAFIKANSEIISIDEYVASEAAELRASKGLGAVDAFTMAAAQKLNAKIVSAYPHFKPFKKYLKKI